MRVSLTFLFIILISITGKNFNIAGTNKNFKTIKKLDLRGIDQQKNDNDNNKPQIIHQNKSDVDRESFAERQISKDLEKYNEFLSKEDELCDKLLNYQVPYYFLGINSKQSLSTNGKDMIEAHLKEKEDFLSKYEKKLEKLTPNTNNIQIFTAQKFPVGSTSIHKKINKK